MTSGTDQLSRNEQGIKDEYVRFLQQCDEHNKRTMAQYEAVIARAEEADRKAAEIYDAAKKQYDRDLAAWNAQGATSNGRAARGRRPSPPKRPRKVIRPRKPAKIVCRPRRKPCVSADSSSIIALSPDFEKNINARMGTNVDFGKLGEWEGGAHTRAYHPWWPDVQADGTAKTYTRTNPDGTKESALDGEKLPGSDKRNRAGVTISVGFDLKKEKDALFRILSALNQRTQYLKPEELKDLKYKLEPYLGFGAGAACLQLRQHPLTLTAKEAEFLALQAHEEAVTKASKAVEGGLNQLSREAQTVLVSRVYHEGNLEKYNSLIDAMRNGNWPKAIAELGGNREAQYLRNYVNSLNISTIY